MSPVASPLATRLAELVGTGALLSDPSELAAFEVDGLIPSLAVRPASVAEVAAILRFAAAEHLAVIPCGGRTKLRIGMTPRKYDLGLDLSAMNRVLAYDPQDLTLGVEPGIRFIDLEPRLADRGQFLPLAPTFADRATLGGMIASRADSPLRYAYGTARDCLLGLEFVTGEGVASKSGGRVVKNVTGYDLHKFLIGSLGTLAVITRLNFRTFPLPHERRMFLLSFPDPASALELCRTIAKSPLQPRVVDMIGPRTARLLSERASAKLPVELWSVVIDVAGHHEVVERHARDFAQMAREVRAVEFLAVDEAQSDVLFAAVREFPRHVLASFPHAAIFRTPAQPTELLATLQLAGSVAQRHALNVATLIRASGLVYTALLPPQEDSNSPALLAACREWMDSAIAAGARPMIEWCSPSVKSAMSVWPPLGSEQLLVNRLKNVFDPHGILSPGRFQGGL